MISVQIYENHNDKSTPLLESSSLSSSSSSSSKPQSPSTSPLVKIMDKYKQYSVTIGCLFGLFIYLGTAFIVSKFVKDDQVYATHVPLLLFGSVWTTAVLLASVMLLAVLQTLIKSSKRSTKTQTTAKTSWHSMLVILICCFILGFEVGAGLAWVGFLGWRRPASYNAMFAAYIVLICILTGWALRAEDEKLEEAVAKQGDDTSSTRTYEPILVV